MKKLCLVLTLFMLAALCGCTQKTTVKKSNKPTATVSEADLAAEIEADLAAEIETDSGTKVETVDVDLTKLSSTMVYSEVYNMMNTPDSYIGKYVRMNGKFQAYTNQDQSQYYPAVVIADATACCSQGLEFVLKGDKVYPKDYPTEQTEVTVIGRFETYYEGDQLFCHLVDAVLE